MIKICFCSCLIVCLSAGTSHAGALLYRIKQKQMMKQRQQQLAYQEYLQQQGVAVTPEGAPVPSPTPETYQQKIDRRNKAIAQAILDAHKKTSFSQVAFGNEPQTNPVPQTTAQTPASVEPAPVEAVGEGQEDVDLAEIWKKLDKKSTIWKAIADDQAKVLTVSEYLNRFHNEGVRISQPPLHYVQMIDQMSKNTPAMLDLPFGELLKIMAIVDYDFDNGMNKDDLARKVLGEQGFEENKKRFTQ